MVSEPDEARLAMGGGGAHRVFLLRAVSTALASGSAGSIDAIIASGLLMRAVDTYWLITPAFIAID
jgi:hypothetical protein